MSNQDDFRDKIEQANQSLDILEIANRLTILHKNGREWAGPCPVCRAGVDRFYVVPKDQRCGCRKCDTGWDSVGLWAAAHGIKPMEALRELIGESGYQHRQTQKQQPIKPPSNEWESVEWQDTARTALSSLKARPEEGTDSWRGLSEQTIESWSCGFTSAKFDPSYGKNRPAFVMPWLSSDGKVYNVKYRFTNDRESKLRFISISGGNPIIFGEQMLVRNDLLIVTEGEINALSLWQECNEFADVVSVGSDSNNNSKEYVNSLIENRGYDQVLGWFDCPSKAITFRDFVPGSKTMTSPGGKDANDILRTGFSLREVVEAALNSNCSLCMDKRFLVIQGVCKKCICQEAK